MNKEQTVEAIRVMQGWLDGADIQFREREFQNPWSDWKLKYWDFWNYEYRIKPEPREWEVLLDHHNWTMTIRQPGEGDRNWIKVREIIE